MTVHVAAFPENVSIGPGENGAITVSVTNTSSLVDSFDVKVLGLQEDWVEITPERLSLFPGETQQFDIVFNLPEKHPSSQRLVAIHVASEAEPSAFSLTNVELVVLPTAFTTVTTDPTVVYGGRKAVFGLIVANSGNAPVTAMGFAIDPEDLAKFTLDPPAVLVPPGGEQVIQIRAKGGLSLIHI